MCQKSQILLYFFTFISPHNRIFLFRVLLSFYFLKLAHPYFYHYSFLPSATCLYFENLEKSHKIPLVRCGFNSLSSGYIYENNIWKQPSKWGFNEGTTSQQKSLSSICITDLNFLFYGLSKCASNKKTPCITPPYSLESTSKRSSK